MGLLPRFRANKFKVKDKGVREELKRVNSKFDSLASKEDVMAYIAELEKKNKQMQFFATLSPRNKQKFIRILARQKGADFGK